MRASFLLLLLAVPACLYSSPQDESCAALLKADNEVSRKFLDEQSATRHSPCITALITRLGKARDKNSVHVLARYLDYVDPATAPRPDGGADVRPNYPAVSALFLIGEPATRELLSAIQTAESPKTRENAANTFMFVYRDDLAAGVRLLKKEELVAKSTDPRSRLDDALRKLLDACNGRSQKEVEQCKGAAGKE